MNPLRNNALRIAVFSLLSAVPCAFAGTPEEDVYPKPQAVKRQGSAMVDAAKLAPASYAKNAAVKGALQDALKTARVKAAGTVPVVVEKDDGKIAAAFRKNKIEDVPGAYFLKVAPAKIEIFAKDDAGVFYAAQTLARIAGYFSVSVDSLLGVEPQDELGFDDFTYALFHETKELTPENKEKLLEMARFFRGQQSKGN